MYEREWTVIGQLVEILKIFRFVTKEFEVEKRPNISLMFPLVRNLSLSIEQFVGLRSTFFT